MPSKAHSIWFACLESQPFDLNPLFWAQETNCLLHSKDLLIVRPTNTTTHCIMRLKNPRRSGVRTLFPSISEGCNYTEKPGNDLFEPTFKAFLQGRVHGIYMYRHRASWLSNTPILSSFLLTRHALLSILQHLAPISLQRLIRCNHCQVKINSHCFRNRMSEFPTSRVRKMVCVRNSVCTCVRAHTHTRARASGVRVCVCRYVFSLSLVCL